MIDTSRWDEFVPRPGDIFVCTPAKCGTTWMQAICTLLVQGRSELTEKLAETSPWLDRVDVPIEDVANLFHYSELVSDLKASLERIAVALEIEANERLLSSVADAVSFTNMKTNYEHFTPAAGTGFWSDDARFFNKGTVGQWRGVIGREALKKYDASIGTLLPEEDVLWIQGADFDR